MKRMAFQVTLLMLTTTLSAAAPKLRPIDESSKSPSFKKFKIELLAAIKRKDVASIESILAPDVKVSFGGESGVDDFRNHWRLSSSDSPLWKELQTILRLGGTFDDKTRKSFTAPYVFSRWPDEYDAFEYGAIIGSRVNLRQSASITAPVIRQATYEILRVCNWEPQNKDWIEVELSGDRKGFVHQSLIRSPIDYRVNFKQQDDGRWKIHFLLAGD